MNQLKPWGEPEKKHWFKEQKVKRSYQNEVVQKIKELQTHFEIITYGALSLDPKRYPLFLIKSRNFDSSKKVVCITGGVHGYETSGVHGALAFLSQEAKSFERYFNFIVAPCISPWGYETINRWNPLAIDPNRSFYQNSPSEECDLFLKAFSSDQEEIFAHFDLHETTDTDNSIFRPALAARDGKELEITDIPDGFYLVGNTDNPCPEFQRAIIDEVRKVTHIAPADKEGKIIGAPLEQEGVINYAVKKLFLCGGFSSASYATTTEVYPDSPNATEDICVKAQVAAIRGGLNFLKAKYELV